MITKELLITKICKINKQYDKLYLNDTIIDLETHTESEWVYVKVNLITDGNIDNVSVTSGCSNNYTYYDFSVNNIQSIEEDGYFGDFLKQVEYIFKRHKINIIDIIKSLHGYDIVRDVFEDDREISKVTSNFIYKK
jgi:hypothetical protein